MNRKKTIAETDFTRDLVFKEVLRRNPHLCREIIRRCCPEVDTENMTISTEYEIIADTKDKRVRLDILSETDSRRIDLEMFTYDPGVVKAARYNAAMMDAQLPLGSVPDDLPDVTVIFLCTFDPLRYGLPVYTIVSKVEEMPDKDYNEGRKIMFLSPTAIREAPERLHPVLAVLTETEEFKDEPFVQSVEKAVREVKSDTEFRRLLMDEKLKEYCIRKEEFTKGKNEGIAEGEEKELIISIRNLRKAGIGNDRIFDLISESHSMDKEKIIEMMKKAG